MADDQQETCGFGVPLENLSPQDREEMESFGRWLGITKRQKLGQPVSEEEWTWCLEYEGTVDADG